MSNKVFPELPAGYPFPQLERDVLEIWRREEVFQATLDKTRNGSPFVFYEGPPTANNVPHVGHVVTRVVKDLLPRFQTMKGRHVPRKAGWDTHGLPVEIEVEKRLGFTGKEDIERYGVEAFNRMCLESVHTYERQWREMSERVGFWIDFDHAYFTYHNTYIESVWWALEKLWKDDLLYEGYKIQPYCARCGTTLSSHEVAQNYRDTEDPSIWVRFALRPGQDIQTTSGEAWPVPEGADLVAWTTTPWTVLANVALAVNPELTYQAVEDPAEPSRLLIFAENLGVPVPLEIEGKDGKRRRLDLREQPAAAVFPGASLVGLRYDRPFHLPAETSPESSPVDDDRGYLVFAGDFVTADDGTGIVHLATYGEDDYKVIKAQDLPIIPSVESDGTIVETPETSAIGVAGRWFKEADRDIARALRSSGRLLHLDQHKHSYPFCWRCDRPLLYYPARSWFIRTTAARERLIEHNREISWHPEHIGEGRFGKWLENVVDWALSRKRYWGTPLPVWRCTECGEIEVVGSFAALFAKAGKELPEDPYDRDQFDPHRPFVDAEAGTFVWSCGSCGAGRMERVEEVIDAWFDSGSMPYAQHHYPFENAEVFAAGFPADFIAEAIDQTRGWFYTLHTLGVLLFDSLAYRNCIVLGHVNDEEGRKMSKRLGNVVDPMKVIPETGADALRWYFYINNPEITSRFSSRLVREAAQSFLIPLWNALSFFSIYANIDGWSPAERETDRAERPALDRWILSRLDQTVEEVARQLEAFSVAEAARAIEGLVDDLTNWYIRRSRERFWAGESDTGADKEGAYRTLFETLSTLARVIAPFTPFLAEVIHRHLESGRGNAPVTSVHLEDWPRPPAGRIDEALLHAMAAVQRIVKLGRAARNAHDLRTRQPLARVTLVSADTTLRREVAPYLDIVRDELNVHAIEWAERRSDYVRHELRPVFPKLGPRFGKRMPALKAALEAADGDALTEELEQRGTVTVAVDGESTELTADELEVRLIERAGAATAADRETLVALDAELTPELIAEGWAREIIHRIQTARKDAGLDYADRIRVRYQASPELAPAIAAHTEWIIKETLAASLEASSETDDSWTEGSIDDHAIALSIEPIEQ